MSCLDSNHYLSSDVTQTDDNPLRGNQRKKNIGNVNVWSLLYWNTGFFSYQDSIADGTVKSSIEYNYVPMAQVMTGQ